MLYTLVGSLLMLVAILATAFTYQAAHGGTWDGAFDLLTLAGSFGFDTTLQLLRVRGLLPRLRHQGADVPVPHLAARRPRRGADGGSVILAGVLLKLGGYGFIRFALPLFPEAAHDLGAGVIIVLSLIAIIYGAIVALVQPDLKKLVAYRSVSHMGFVTLGIFVFTAAGARRARSSR